MGIYYIREMTVLNLNSSNILYQNFPSFHNNRTVYIQNISDNLKETFFLGHYYMETMMGVHLDLSPNNSFHLNTKPFKTQIEYDINKTRIVTSSLSIAIVQTYSYFYNLILSDFISYNSTEVRNFMYNAMNNVAIGMENIVKIYFDEIKKKQKKYITTIIIYYVAFLIIYIFIFILMTISYFKIIQRKNSYISVFYDISLTFIKTSMIKCEKFLRKINPNELFIVQEKNDNLDDSLSFSNFEEDNFLFNKNSKKPSEHKIINNNGKEKKVKYKDTSKSKVFGLKFFIFLGICYIYIFLILWSFMNQISIIEIMSTYVYHMQHLHNNILNLFIAFREFIFDSNSSMHNTNIIDYFLKTESELHYYFSKDIIYSAEHCIYVKGLCKVFKEIQKNQLCNSGEEISSIDICDYYIEVITSLGFFNFISFWVEEIRIRKNYVLLLTELDKIIKLWNDDDEMRIITVYNSLDIHPDVNYMFNFGILTFINQERNLTIEKMMETFKTINRDYVITMIIYFVLIVIFYIIYLNPIIDGIKILIYKTKNMLTIIPVEVLASQTNIKNILNISDLND
jgi:hypothetical protein